jgi:prevent-host-death family protein
LTELESHEIFNFMKTMSISDFKAKVIQCLKNVKATREPLQISLRGKPLAVVYPAEPEQKPSVKLGTGAAFRIEDGPEPDWFGTEFASEWTCPFDTRK